MQTTVVAQKQEAIFDGSEKEERRFQVTQLLNSQALESMADALLDGTLDVQEARATVAIGEVLASKPSRFSVEATDDPDVVRYELPARVAPVVPESMGNHRRNADGSPVAGDPKAACLCDSNPGTRRLYLFSEGAAPLFGRDEDRDLAAGLKAYNSLPKSKRRTWLRRGSLEADLVRTYIGMKQLAAFIEESCPAANHYVRCHTAVWNDLLRSPTTHDDQVKQTEDRDLWTQQERERLAWPLVAFEPADADRGYLPDPTNIKSGSALAREYAGPSSYETVEYVKDDHGYVLLEEDGSRMQRTVTVQTMGAVQWEYRRRKQMARVPGLTPLPYWMTKANYKVVKQQEARMDKRRLERKMQRRRLIALIEKMGGDPRDPKVAEWVRSNGVASCLASLRRREAVTA